MLFLVKGRGLLRTVLEEALRAARDVLADAVVGGVVGEPMGRGFYGDLSYKGDIVCERAILDALKGELDSFVVVSEEMGVLKEGTGEPEYWVLIDPVDGSANMSRNISFYSSGIALARGPMISDVVCSGVIDHITGELFVREGDYVSHRAVSNYVQNKEGGKGGYCTFFHHASFKKSHHVREASFRIAAKLRFFRVMGSALLEMCYAATGRADGYLCLTSELRTMDIVPALYFARGIGCKIATRPKSLMNEKLDSKSRYGIIMGGNVAFIEEVLSILRTGWNIIE